MGTETNGKMIKDYLKSLTADALNDLLGKVLTEMRDREDAQMRVDVIATSQSLRRKTTSVKAMRAQRP